MIFYIRRELTPWVVQYPDSRKFPIQLSHYLQTYYYPYMSATVLRAAEENLAGAFSINAKQKKREIRFEVSKNGEIFYHNPDKLLTQNANLVEI